jgi:Zn finger protein HypA/HybF involved in hydrogenase expression
VAGSVHIYVRGTGGGDKNYHWCRNCRAYPRQKVSHATVLRPAAFLCPECKKREHEARCEA